MNMAAIIAEVCDISPTESDTANAREVPGDGYKNSESVNVEVIRSRVMFGYLWYINHIQQE